MTSTKPKHTLTLDPSNTRPPTRDSDEPARTNLPSPKATKSHTEQQQDVEAEPANATLHFLGTATTILEWSGIRLMTDPNFLHAGDHVHLGPGVTGTRVTNPSIDLHDLPKIDVVLLSHYHADHFDQLVEKSLRRDLPIVTTPHAREHLHEKKSAEERFSQVYDLDHFEDAILDISSASNGRKPAIKVTGMPGKHVPPGPLNIANDLLNAIPPTNGWIVELGHHNPASNSTSSTENWHCGYRIYISGDTLFVDDLKEIPKLYTDANKPIDLMLVHLGGTTIPSPSLPLLMVTMDAVQGVKLMQLIRPETTIPIHFDDYDVFLSPLEDFRKEVERAGLSGGVVYLDRGDAFSFAVRE